MKTRVVLVNPCEDREKPYKVQFKKGLFWHNYKYKITSNGGDDSVNIVQMFSEEEAKEKAKELLRTSEYEFSTKQINENKGHCL